MIMLYVNYCTYCFNKETDRNEQNRMKYGLDGSKVGILKTSDRDLDYDERRVKYENYDHILCERCSKKIYYYCYDCYDKEIKELKELQSDLQIYEEFYFKLYNEETKELKELEKIESILQYHENVYSKVKQFPDQI